MPNWVGRVFALVVLVFSWWFALRAGDYVRGSWGISPGPQTLLNDPGWTLQKLPLDYADEQTVMFLLAEERVCEIGGIGTLLALFIASRSTQWRKARQKGTTTE